MATIEEVNAKVLELNSVVAAIDLKLDDVRAFVAQLQAGSVVTQEQLDQLAAALDGVKASADSVLAEADSTDGTP